MNDENPPLIAKRMSVEPSSVEGKVDLIFTDAEQRPVVVTMAVGNLRNVVTVIEAFIAQTTPQEAQYRELLVRQLSIQVFDDGGCYVDVQPGLDGAAGLRLALPPGLGASLRDVLPSDPDRASH